MCIFIFVCISSKITIFKQEKRINSMMLRFQIWRAPNGTNITYMIHLHPPFFSFLFVSYSHTMGLGIKRTMIMMGLFLFTPFCFSFSFLALSKSQVISYQRRKKVVCMMYQYHHHGITLSLPTIFQFGILLSDILILPWFFYHITLLSRVSIFSINASLT